MVTRHPIPRPRSRKTMDKSAEISYWNREGLPLTLLLLSIMLIIILLIVLSTISLPVGLALLALLPLTRWLLNLRKARRR